MESDLSRRIDAKIKEKTGLTSKKAVDAYDLFCRGADFDGMAKGVILRGGVQSDFYSLVKKEILEKKGITSLDMIGKKAREKIEEEITHSAIRRQSYWYNFFKEKGLISAPRKPYPKCPYVTYKAPMLLGYNPFNDTEFYIPYKSKGQTEFMGRVSRDFLTPEERKRREELGDVFKI